MMITRQCCGSPRFAILRSIAVVVVPSGPVSSCKPFKAVSHVVPPKKLLISLLVPPEKLLISRVVPPENP